MSAEASRSTAAKETAGAMSSSGKVSAEEGTNKHRRAKNNGKQRRARKRRGKDNSDSKSNSNTAQAQVEKRKLQNKLASVKEGSRSAEDASAKSGAKRNRNRGGKKRSKASSVAKGGEANLDSKSRQRKDVGRGEQWTDKQQMQFEEAYAQGIKKFGFSWREDAFLLKGFFENVKRSVKGKSAQECYERFQLVRALAVSALEATEGEVDGEAETTPVENENDSEDEHNMKLGGELEQERAVRERAEGTREGAPILAAPHVRPENQGGESKGQSKTNAKRLNNSSETIRPSKEYPELGEKQSQSSTAGTWADSERKSSEYAEWSPQEQQLLDAALAKYKDIKSTKERWNCIAAMVPTKSLKECVVQYKSLREALKMEVSK